MSSFSHSLNDNLKGKVVAGYRKVALSAELFNIIYNTSHAYTVTGCLRDWNTVYEFRRFFNRIFDLDQEMCVFSEIVKVIIRFGIVMFCRACNAFPVHWTE